MKIKISLSAAPIDNDAVQRGLKIAVDNGGFIRYDHHSIDWPANTDTVQAIKAGVLLDAFWQKSKTGPGIMGYATKDAIAKGKGGHGSRIIAKTNDHESHISAETFNSRVDKK